MAATLALAGRASEPASAADRSSKRGTRLAPNLRRPLISQILFGQFAELVRNGAGKSQNDRPISDGLPSEATTDRVNGAVGHPARHSPFGAGPALLVFKSKREFQLHDRVLLQIRYRDRQE